MITIDFHHLDCWQREEFFKRVDEIEDEITKKHVPYVKGSGDILDTFQIETNPWVIERIQTALKEVEKLHLGSFKVST